MAAYSHQLTDYDFHLPPGQIAQQPAGQRDQSRLLVLSSKEQLQHQRFSDLLDHFSPGDLLVVNNTKVFPARLLGRKATGGKAELFLLEFPTLLAPGAEGTAGQQASALGLIKSSKRPKPGSVLHFSERLSARIEAYQEDGKARVVLEYHPEQGEDLEALIQSHGQVPLPPYIQRSNGTTEEDQRRYQTKYAHHPGSVAAPTAGLHFSEELLEAISRKGVELVSLTLHVGYGTFAPVRSADIRNHQIHREHLSLSPEAAGTINAVKERGGRIWAVGTTSVRSLEFATDSQGVVRPMEGSCDLFIYPGYRFRTVDNLITNFHLPQSSLLFLVSALAGREKILGAYKEAVARGYRFFSYGDAMAIITREAGR
ncbi:tRNA preQ1(34) S-adenosylmethionine ribosyltransferase-isomerase QueA [Desulfogranum mediterraneum]|uniref:tRNA preQ1(34) S-adenosylmethionine ribosyltransferase-isomerase QueA n=1 Tax=Desulfogranum mediterraneum TaxID=160661 RepID=UPI0004181BB9|nr:tRNA preQ1(34) S-adenosylmethionine ribosyltransferase-isomerase QueA [Desulfogranum mediterraneum]